MDQKTQLMWVGIYAGILSLCLLYATVALRHAQRRYDKLVQWYKDDRKVWRDLFDFAVDQDIATRRRLTLCMKALYLVRQWWAEVYPETVFIGGPDADEGVRRVVEIREAVEAAYVEVWGQEEE